MALSLISFSDAYVAGGPIASVAITLSGVLAGDSIVIGTRYGSVPAGAAASVSDGSNTYVAAAPSFTSSIITGEYPQFFLCSSVAVGGTLTVTVTLPTSGSRNTYPWIAGWVIRGGPIGLDSAASASAFTVGTTPVSSPAFNTSYANEAVFAIGGNTSTFASYSTPGAGWTLDDGAGPIWFAEHAIFTSLQTGVTATITSSVADNEIYVLGFGVTSSRVSVRESWE